MTTAERIDALAPVLEGFREEFGQVSADDLRRWVTRELGRLDALDAWESRNYSGHRSRAIAPRRIQHILAGNLAVSGMQSLLCGLLVGAENVVKLPSGEEDQGAAGRIREFVRALPEALRARVAWRPEAEVDPEAGVVIVYGGEQAAQAVRERVRLDQRLLIYGPKASLAWLGSLEEDRATFAGSVASCDVVAHDQAGCLSPQAVYLLAGPALDAFVEALRNGLDLHTAKSRSQPHLAQAAAIRDLRATSAALGDRVLTPLDNGLRWTVIVRSRPGWEFSPGHRTILVRPVASLEEMACDLQPLQGRLSTVGCLPPLDPAAEALFGQLDVCRLCGLGAMQHPPIDWHHDGRPQLADLVTWRDLEL